jgi:hypothetical protein
MMQITLNYIYGQSVSERTHLWSKLQAATESWFLNSATNNVLSNTKLEVVFFVRYGIDL